MKRLRRSLLSALLALSGLGHPVTRSCLAQDPVQPFPELKQNLEQQCGHPFRVSSMRVIHVLTDADEGQARLVLQHLFPMMPKIRAFLQFSKDAPFPQTGVQIALFQNPQDCQRYIEQRGQRWNGSFAYLHDIAPQRCVIAAFVLPEVPLLARLRHEAVLCMLYAWFQNPPLWLAEGLGECAEQMYLDDQELVQFGPMHSQLRDLRKFSASPEARLSARQLLALDREAWNRAPRSSYLHAWSFCRFMLEGTLLREARLLSRTLQNLKPAGSETENLKLASELILEDEWAPLQEAWEQWVASAVETPAEKPYQEGLRLLDTDPQRASAQFSEAINLDPAYERIYYFYALALYKTGNHTQAVRNLEEAVRLFPEYHAARYLRAMALLAEGKRDQAQQDLQTLLQTSYAEKARAMLKP